jgi:arylsulfatase A-like enzyme
MISKRSLVASLLLSATALLPTKLSAQQADDAATPKAPVVLPFSEPTFQGEVGRTFKDSDPPQFPRPVRPPQGAPNVVVILLDDAGFGQFSTFGGGTPSPTADKLAAEGLRYNEFHTTALCSPTRAALLTGRNHHSSGFGVISEITDGYDGYTGILPKSTATIAETLHLNGYATAWFGKNHNTPAWEQNPAGPFDHWPSGYGFDYFYGFMGGNASQWEPLMFENHTPVPRSADPNYHMAADLADRSIDWIRSEQAIDPQRPYFLYLAPGGTHSPHHAPKDWIDKFKGQFDAGWDVYRAQTLQRQKALGVVPANTMLTARAEGIPAWDSLEPDQKRLYAHMMEVFAAYGAYTDHEMGRVVDAIRKMPNGDNTMIMYIMGDNGASAEGGLDGTLNEIAAYSSVPMTWKTMLPAINDLGSKKYDNHFPVGWALAMNTPFQWTKQVASHFGGTRNPMIISWPARIKDKGGLRPQFQHIIDVAPTILEAAGLPQPTMVNGVAQKPIEGVSMEYTFDGAKTASHRKTQYFEMQGYRGIYHDGWMASSITFQPWVLLRPEFDIDKAKWELYKIDEDFSQAHDIAAANPGKLKEMEDLFWAEAAKYNVLPIDWRSLERSSDEPMGRPNPTIGRKHFEYPGNLTGVLLGSAPVLVDRSFTITADIDIHADKPDGMLFTQGGFTAGWGFFVQNGKLVAEHNFLGLQRYRIESSDPLPAGKATVAMDFTYDGGGRGKGGRLLLSVNGKPVGEGRVERTVPQLYSAFEGQDIGMDNGSPIDESYAPPFKFQGRIDSVTVDLK